MQALLEATQGSCGVTEQACQIVLIGVSGFVQRNQGIGFGGAILPGVVRVDDAMDKNDALVPFGLEGNASIHEDHLRNRGEVGKKIAGIGSRVHGRIACLRRVGEKSGQVLVRTLKGESQMRLRCKSRTAISRWGRGRCERHPDGRLKKRQVLVRTLEGENPSQMRLGCKSCTAISRWGRGRCERHPDGRLKKRSEERRVGKECRSRWSPYH